MIILFSGSHGTGKSTLLQLLSQKLPHLKINDSTSEKFFKREDFNDLKKMVKLQDDFTNYQLQQFKTENTLSSRAYGDIYAYTTHLFKKSQDTDYLKQTQKIIKEAQKAMSDENTLIVYFPIHFEIEGKELRSTNKDFQKEIDDLIKFFYREMGYQVYEVINGSPEQRLEHLLEHIKEKYGNNSYKI